MMDFDFEDLYFLDSFGFQLSGFPDSQPLGFPNFQAVGRSTTQVHAVWKSGNPNLWNQQKNNANSQHQNPCHPKCWQGLDWPEKRTSQPHLKHFPVEKEPRMHQQLPIFLGGPM